MPAGGKRSGAGRKKGKVTIEKEAMRLIVRQRVAEHLEPLLKAQVDNAQGIAFVMLREQKGGRWRRLDRAPKPGEYVGKEDELVEVYYKDPSVQAFTDLLNRACDKPIEQQQLQVSGTVDLVQRLQAAKKRSPEGKRG